MVCAIVIPFTTASAEDPAPLQFSMLELNAPDKRNVKGVRLSVLYGESGNMSGLDLALGLSELDNMTGLSLPLFVGGNRVNGQFKGLAMGLVNIHEGSDTGINLGGLNLTNNVNGISVGIANISTGDTLADISAVNISEESTFQVGFFNKTDTIVGVQIGFLNCANNGFFPCFPIINFAAD
ncbi:MAG: phaC PHA synthase [Gammaproteobacteria bacterium]|nr:phaC PHA synthase [Gammaproteobacteria bacterium]